MLVLSMHLKFTIQYATLIKGEASLINANMRLALSLSFNEHEHFHPFAKINSRRCLPTNIEDPIYCKVVTSINAQWKGCLALQVTWSYLVQGLFTPWTMKSSQGHVKFVIGCWTCPGTTLVCTKGKKMLEWPWSSRSPKDIFQGLHYPLTWSNGFCVGEATKAL